MTVQSTGFTASRTRYLTQQQRDEKAKKAREEERIKALWFMYRNNQMDIAEILGLAPAAALSSTWRETLGD